MLVQRKTSETAPAANFACNTKGVVKLSGSVRTWNSVRVSLKDYDNK